MDSKTVELDSPAPPDATEAQVVIRVQSPPKAPRRLSEILRAVPPGTRTKADIDRQIEEEREAWDE
ncbi:MAG: hypothetical protein HY317_04675 [Acidobacteria bacterium]|nr:hypothetical protein [Acidobacteriota bacterium]